MLNRLKSFLGIPHPWSVDDLTKSEKLMYFGSNPTEYSDERLFAIVKSEKGWSTDDKVQAYKHLVDRGKVSTASLRSDTAWGQGPNSSLAQGGTAAPERVLLCCSAACFNPPSPAVCV